MPVTPLPDGEAKPLTASEIDFALGGRRDDGRGERMLARPLDAGGKPQQDVLVEILQPARWR